MSSPLIQGVVSKREKSFSARSARSASRSRCLLASGHLLIERPAGRGKTTLAQVLAKLLGLNFHRIQFTSEHAPRRHHRRIGL